MRIWPVLVCSAWLGLSTVAAQETIAVAQQPNAECLCVLSGAVETAALEDVRGQVLMADDFGYEPVETKVQLSPGDRVVLLGDGQAILVAAPTCRAALAPTSMISLIRTRTGTCITQSWVSPIQAQSDETPTSETSVSGNLLQAGGLLVSGGLIIGGGLGAAARAAEADTPISP